MTMEDQLSKPASHGNRVVGHGDCPLCGRPDVPLAWKERYGTRRAWMICANEFACLAAYSARAKRNGG